MTMTTIRSIVISNGTDTRTVEILQDERGFWLHDTADVNHNSLTQVDDDSDTAVQDALVGDWQIAEASDAVTDHDLQDMMEMLGNHGGMFTGNHPADEAANWIDHGFTAESASPWCEIGVWDAATANAFVASKLTPEQVAAAAERMTDSLDDPGEEYTDGDPIYAACNGDLDVAKIIQAAD